MQVFVKINRYFQRTLLDDVQLHGELHQRQRRERLASHLLSLPVSSEANLVAGSVSGHHEKSPTDGKS